MPPPSEPSVVEPPYPPLPPNEPPVPPPCAPGGDKQATHGAVSAAGPWRGGDESCAAASSAPSMSIASLAISTSGREPVTLTVAWAGMPSSEPAITQNRPALLPVYAMHAGDAPTPA